MSRAGPTAHAPREVTMRQAISAAVALRADHAPWVLNESNASWRRPIPSGGFINLSLSYDLFDRETRTIRPRITVSGAVASNIEEATIFAERLREATAAGNLIKGLLAAYVVRL